MTKPAKKIYANKTDSCATVVHKVISSGLDEFILYFPKAAEIAENPKNFKLLKREAAAVGKTIVIESVDGNLLEMAFAAGFEVVDGLFNRSASPSSKVPLMDIMPAKSKLESLSAGAPETEPDEVDLSDEKPEQAQESPETGEVREEEPTVKAEEYRAPRRRISPWKKMGFATAFAASLGIVGYLALFILPTAKISIERKKTDWSFTGTVTASVKAPAVSGTDLQIPSQIFTVSKNGIYKFPASGSEVVKRKASGKVTIWNAYSSEIQQLVKNTRFVTPEGKVYRIVSAVTVPGAKISEGKIQASSVEVDIVADEPGEAYNTGPVAKLRIPGFQGSPKYDGFYGEFKTDVSGGFVGEMKVPTDDDIKRAKEETAAKVDAAVKSSVMMTIPPEFKVVESAIAYEVTKSEVVSDADEKGEFSYGVIMEAKVPAYKEEDLIALMGEKFKEQNADPYDLIVKELAYSSDPSADLSSGKISLPVEFSGTWARSFDPSVFRGEILGASEESLKSSIFAIPGVLSAKADLWPFWATSVPTNPEKIEISVD